MAIDPNNSRARGRGAKVLSNLAVAGSSSPEFSPKLLASSPNSHRMSPRYRGRDWIWTRRERQEVSHRGEKEKSEVEV